MREPCLIESLSNYNVQEQLELDTINNGCFFADSIIYYDSHKHLRRSQLVSDELDSWKTEHPTTRPISHLSSDSRSLFVGYVDG